MNKQVMLHHGDCLEEMKKIEDGSVDMILTDLPYGTMEGQSKTGIYHGGEERHKWDNVIDTYEVFSSAERVLRNNGKMVLFAQEPFTSELIRNATNNVSFNYRAVWLKDSLGSFMRSKKALLYKTEDILIFSKTVEDKSDHPLQDYFCEEFSKSEYTVKQYCDSLGTQHASHFFTKGLQFRVPNETYLRQLQDMTGLFDITIDEVKWKHREFLDKNRKDYGSTFNLWEGGKYKHNVFEYKRDRDNYHPTQKPVLLLEDLIKTFSNESNTVLDMTMGSGSTGVACVNTNRKFIGIELDEGYFNIAKKRMVV